MSVLPRMHGIARLRFTATDGGTRLADLHQVSPLRVLFPHPVEGDPPTAVVTTVSGGLVGGDSHQIDITAGPAAAVLVAAQAAEKVYRSTGAACRVDLRLQVGDRGWGEFLPQETILFDGARLVRRTVLDTAGGGRALAGEIVVFGRLARGERWRQGAFRDGWEVRHDGRLVWADALHLEGRVAERLDDPAGFDGATAIATLVFAAPDAAQALPRLRALLPGAPMRAAATFVNGVLVARWLATDPLALRRSFAACWCDLRAAAGGWPARLPRFWHV